MTVNDFLETRVGKRLTFVMEWATLIIITPIMFMMIGWRSIPPILVSVQSYR